jgi:predicted  nucleic acid-binding Zn-ribbon protein
MSWNWAGLNRKEALARVKSETFRLQNDPRLNQISLDIDSEQLARDVQLNSDQLANFKVEATKAQTEATQKKSEVGTLQQESATLKAQLQVLRGQLTAAQKTVTQFSARLQESRP